MLWKEGMPPNTRIPPNKTHGKASCSTVHLGEGISNEDSTSYNKRALYALEFGDPYIILCLQVALCICKKGGGDETR